MPNCSASSLRWRKKRGTTPLDPPLQGLLRRVQRLDYIGKARRADQQEINIAAGIFLATRQRAEDEDQRNLAAQGLQGLRQHIDQPGGFTE